MDTIEKKVDKTREVIAATLPPHLIHQLQIDVPEYTTIVRRQEATDGTYSRTDVLAGYLWPFWLNIW